MTLGHYFLSQSIPSGNQNFFHSKIMLSHDLILSQREWTSFLCNSNMQENYTKISKTKLKGFDKKWYHLYLET